MFGDIYKDKKVLITGHTGFKGSWLTTWLLKLGARVVGISNAVPTNPSMFKELKLEQKISHCEEDIRDLSRMTEIISSEKPDFLFHLAAQPIVSSSYDDPIETISSNVMGTANILEALKVSNHECTAVLITSDKAYDNVEQVWGYKENDLLGGKDIYSGSKGAAELVIKSYFFSFFNHLECNIRIGVGRAGNVIGGGDWAKDRIVVDCMQAWSNNEVVEIRNPISTRPWQHVLEPLSGYLILGQFLYNDKKFHGEAFNFGPKDDQSYTVKELLVDLSKYWDIENQNKPFNLTSEKPFHEACLLKLNSDKALQNLKWQTNLDYLENVRYTGEWYFDYYQHKKDMYQETFKQINDYESLAMKKGYEWTQ